MFSSFYQEKFYQRLFVIFLFFVQSSIFFGQENIQFHHITTDDGLSQSDINSIYKDKKGFIWFATHEGLNKYDGYNFKIFTPDANKKNSINSNLIFALSGDEKGNLWIGTTGKGLNHFNTSTEKFTYFVHDDNDRNSISSNYVGSLLTDKKNRLWAGTTDGVNMINLNTPLDSIKFQHFDLERDPFVSNSQDNDVSCIFEDSIGDIWVGGNNGLFKLMRDSKGEQYFKLVNQILGIADVSVKSINEDVYGRLLIGSGSGLFVLNRNSTNDTQKILKGNNINTILVDNKIIWIGCRSGLLYVDNSNENSLPKLINKFEYNPNNPSSLSKNTVKSLLKDDTGVIWIGTNGGGVNKLDIERKQFKHIKKTLDQSSLSYDKIRSMYEDSNGAIWIGTEGGGLNMLPKEKNNGSYLGFKTFSDIKNAFVTKEIIREGKKILLIGCEGRPGLHKLDITDPNNIRKIDLKTFDNEILNSVFSILEDNDKNLWIGTYSRGVYRWLFDKETNTYKKDILNHNKLDKNSVPNNIIRNIKEDSYGNIWFATGNGLCKLNRKEKLKKHPKFTIYKNEPSDKKSIGHNYILELFESKNGDIWIGTLGGGLSKFIPSLNNKPDSFVNYKIEDGLPNNVVKGILEDDDGNLWVSTNKGLSKFNPIKNDFKNFDINDGLQSNEFQELARLKRKNGELLFGGINGFNSFFPKKIENNSFEPETVITKLSIFNKDIKIGEEVNGRVILEKSLVFTKEIELKHKENSFTFEFSSLHFASPKKNKYAYKLEGFDKDWIYSTSERRFATYTNLPSKNYTFKVKASNNDDLWDNSPSELNIIIVPPFWETNFAFFLYFLGVLGMLFLFRRYTIIGTTEKHRLELDFLEKEKNEELQKIKFEFFTNISHELRTPLTLLKGPLKYLQKKGEFLDQNKIQEQYKLMEKNSDSLLRLVNQLLDFRKVNQGKMRLVMRKSNIVTFIKELSEPFQFFAHKNQIDFEIICNPKKIISWFDHEAIEKIINNLLSNAFKFTQKKGTIQVIVELEDNFNGKNIVIKVKDTGSGIEKERLNNIFERFYIDQNKSENNPKGIGIGLSFVKQLVKLHQGDINVKSEINKGTVFTVHLPIEKKAYENIPEISCKSTKDVDFFVRTSETNSLAISINDEIEDLDIDKSRSEKPILLVVDDNSDIRVFLKQALSDDYIIYEAENGKIGLEKANEILPNIILTDVLMPEMDGIEFCKALKNRQETSHIPVIMLTAKLSQETEIKGLKTGADDYIRKPFDIELLEVKLKNIIKRRDKLRNRFKKDISFEPKDVTVTTLDEKFLQQAIEIVEKHMMNTDFSVEMLVKEMGLSRSTLYLKFKEITGLSSSAFIRNIRLKRAVQLFEKSDYSVKEIMYMTGFNTASYFSKCFKKQFGVIPSEYVRQNLNKDNANKINFESDVDS